MISNRDIWILLIIAIISTLLMLSTHNGVERETNQLSQLLIENSSVNFDEINKITLQKGGELFVFERDDMKWSQVLPFHIRMDSASMSALIRAIEGVQVIGGLTDVSNYSVLGLGEVSDSITVTDGDEVISVRLGRKTLGGRAYAQVGDADPVIIDQSLHHRALDMDYRLWRDVRLFPDFTIDGIRIERIVNKNKLVLDRTSGRWEMVDPVSARVDTDVLLEWVGKLAGIRVGSFVIDEPTDLAMFGLQHPLATFSVRDRNGMTYTLLIGSRVSAGTQDRYVMLDGRPVVDRVRWEALSDLFLQPELLVDATGSAVSRFDVKQVTIRAGGKEIKMQRKLEQWVNETGVPVDVNKVDALLSWVLDTKPPSVVIAQYPRDAEIATITLEGYDLLPLDTIRVARDESSGGLILENGDNVLRLHPAESISALIPFVQNELPQK